MDVAGRWPLPRSEQLRDALLAAYADPGRGYHDLRHLAEVLARIDELGSSGVDVDRDTVILAAWFHDGVYDARPGDEEHSARWAESALATAGADPARVAEVARLVRLTGHHRPETGDLTGAVLSDADLAILAASPERYREYVDGVRREYSHVPDDLFVAGRAEILRGLLAKPTLFHTAYAVERWERAARTNIAAELGHAF